MLDQNTKNIATINGEELECVMCLLAGQNPKQIGRRLNLSIQVVNMHLQSVMKKMDCSNELELMNLLRKLI